MKNKYTISILIPSLNEDENLIILIPKIYEFLKNSSLIKEFEIIIINDGSTDKTEEYFFKLKEEIKNLKLINLKENKSKAFALDVGINYSKGEIIATIDADCQYDPKDFEKMLELIDNGSDFVNGHRVTRKDLVNTVLFSKIYNMILRTLFNTNIKDFFSGIKIYKKKALDIINFNSVPRFFIFFFLRYKFNVKEIDVSHKKRVHGKSTYSFLGRCLLVLQDLFVIIFLIIIGKDKIYHSKQICYFVLLIGSLILLLLNFFLNYPLNNIVYVMIILTVLFISFFKIIDTFLIRKSEKIDYLKFIKSIK